MPVKIIVTRYKCACHGELFVSRKEAEACERESKAQAKKFRARKKEMKAGLDALFG